MLPETGIEILRAIKRAADALERIAERLDQLEERQDLVSRPRVEITPRREAGGGA